MIRAVAGGVLPVLIAGLLDRWWREPPLRAHPVRAMGRLLDLLASAVPSRPPRSALLRGGGAWLVGLVATTGIAVAVDRAAGRLPAVWRAVARGVALWPLVALRMLIDEVAAVEEALAVDLDAGRAAVSRLVSRDVECLDATLVREAAISSLAENLVDGWVAPLGWYAAGGLPAAAAYRYLNTADALWGHHNDRWHHAGRVAARADDGANLLPARLTGIALARPRLPPCTLRRAAACTPSPNGGWPMAAVALRLGIRLTKPGVYVLNPTGRSPAAADTRTAIRLVDHPARLLAAGWMAFRAFVLVVRGRACRR